MKLVNLVDSENSKTCQNDEPNENDGHSDGKFVCVAPVL